MIEIHFNCEQTKHGVTITVTTPKRTMTKRFRNGYATATAVAKTWIREQIEAYQDFEELQGSKKFQFFINGERFTAHSF